MSNQTTTQSGDEPRSGSLDAPVRASELRDGLIPKGQQCPFAEPCMVKDDCPAARPQGNRVDYSCGMARFMDIFGRPNIGIGKTDITANQAKQ